MDQNQAISSIMTRNLTTVRVEEKVKNIKTIFLQNDFHHLPVMDAKGQLAGIISKEDLARLDHQIAKETTGKTWTEKEYASLSAGQIMTKYPMQLDPNDNIGLAADIFLANRFHALPIVDDGELVGLVTTHDLLEYAFVRSTSAQLFKA